MNSDGTNLINLTNSPATDDLRPRFSPNGQEMFFTRKYSNGLHRSFLTNTDGSNLNEIPVLPVLNVAAGDWSPDMMKIVVHAGFPSSPNIYVYDMSTNQTTQLTFNNSTKGIPSWSPEGNWIAYQSNESGIYRIYLVQPDGSNKHLIIPSSGLEEKRPQLSPDGNRILFAARDNSATWDLFIVNLDGTNLIRLTNTRGIDETSHCWSPVETKILYAKNDGSSGWGLYTMNLDGTGIQQILDTPGNENYPHWH